MIRLPPISTLFPYTTLFRSISKLIYNVILMLVMSGLSLILYAIFLGNPLINIPFFIGIVCLGGISLALVFTMLAEIGRDTSELQSHVNLVCRLLLEKKKKKN